MQAMVRLVDNFLVLDHGAVLLEGKPETVTRDTRVIEAYLGKKWVAHAAHEGLSTAIRRGRAQRRIDHVEAGQFVAIVVPTARARKRLFKRSPESCAPARAVSASKATTSFGRTSSRPHLGIAHVPEVARYFRR